MSQSDVNQMNDGMKDVVYDLLSSQPSTVECAECGSSLDVDGTDVDSDLDMTVRVKPCDVCMNEAWKDGKEEGLEDSE